MTVSVGLGRVGSKFFHLYWVGLGWVSQLMGWVGSGHTEWTHGKLCIQSVRVPIDLRRSFGHESEFVLSKYC